MPEGEQQQGTQGGAEAAETSTTTTQQQQTPPPWEKNGQEFSAEKAWTLIQNLTSERDALKGDKAQIQQGQAALMAKLAEALGVQPDKKAGPDDLVGTLQSKVAAMELDRDVERLGRIHKDLTDEDLDTLRALSDAAVRSKVAERLAAASAKPTGKPKADPPSSTTSNHPATQPGISRLRAAYAAEPTN